MPRIAAAPLRVLLGLPIAACFIKPSPPEATVDARVDNDSGSADASVVDAMADAPVITTGCTLDDFVGPLAAGCGAWATEVSPTTFAGNGSLSLSVPVNASSADSASCVTPPVSSTSMTVNITSFEPDDGFTTLALFVTASGNRYAAVINGQAPNQYVSIDCGQNAVAASWSLTTGRYIRLAWTNAASLSFEMWGGASGPHTALITCGGNAGTSREFGIELHRGSNGQAQDATIDYVQMCE